MATSESARLLIYCIRYCDQVFVIA